MMDTYRDKGIICADDALELRHYYLWGGSKTVPYGSIIAVQRVGLTALKGRLRIWGTANMDYWANLDTKRASKTEGLVLDLGKRVKPFITPDDVNQVETLLRDRARLGPAGPTITAPFI
jgi:hypothetical protein